MEMVLDTVPVKVTAEMNQKLLAPFHAEEVKKALFQMFPIKAPEPDGYPAHFSMTLGCLWGGGYNSSVASVAGRG